MRPLLPLLPLLAIACSGGDSGPVRWLRWVPLAEGDDPYATWCSEDFAWNAGSVWERSTGTWRAVPDVPASTFGERGPVTCVGRTLFTSPPNVSVAYRSVDGGAWEAIDPPEGAVIGSVRAGSTGVYRVILSASGVVQPQLERSTDEGGTWEPVGAPFGNPAGGTVATVELDGVEGFVSIGMVGTNFEMGQVRRSLDGGRTVVSTNAFRELDSPIPLQTAPESAGRLLIAYDPYRESWPERYFPPLAMTPRDAIERAAGDFETVLMAGPVELLAVPDPTQHPEAGNLRVHPDGYLLRRDGYRTTTPVDEDERADVLAGPGCSLLERSRDAMRDVEGPGDVTLTHSGNEPVYVGGFQVSRLEWYTGSGTGPQTLLEPGATWAVRGDRPVFFMDAEGRCRGVLRASDGGEVDVADWL
ncbi:MAG: hypothetical protein R3F61_10815 [Myxococcota bacterium]